jgi:hypothetical protein
MEVFTDTWRYLATLNPYDSMATRVKALEQQEEQED